LVEGITKRQKRKNEEEKAAHQRGKEKSITELGSKPDKKHLKAARRGERRTATEITLPPANTDKWCLSKAGNKSLSGVWSQRKSWV